MVVGRADTPRTRRMAKPGTVEEVESKINEITAYSSKLSTARGTSFESLSMEWLIAQKPQLKASSVAKYTNILTSYL